MKENGGKLFRKFPIKLKNVSVKNLADTEKCSRKFNNTMGGGGEENFEEILKILLTRQ